MPSFEPSQSKLKIKYKKNEPDYQEQMRKQTGQGDEIEFIAAVIRISEDANILQEERVTYSVNNLFADVGGDLGLFLGLCVWSMIHSAMHAVVVIRNKAENFKYKRLMKNSKMKFWKKKMSMSRAHLPTPSQHRLPTLSRERSKNSIFSETSTTGTKSIEAISSRDGKSDEIRYWFTV